MRHNNRRAGFAGLDSIISFFVLFLLFLSALICVRLLCRLFTTDRADFPAVANGAFIIVTGLAVLVFTYAQALLDEKESRQQLVKAGEMLFVSSLTLLVSAILRHGVITKVISGGEPTQTGDDEAFVQLIFFLAYILFGVAIILAHVAVWHLASIWQTRGRSR